MAKKASKKMKYEIGVPEKTADIETLKAIIASKENLLKHAFATDDVSLTLEDGKILFKWFTEEPGSDDATAYILFVSALCRMSKSIKKVNTWDKEVPNEKYAFRCFLLRLGFIGDEYKAARKILLRNLEGNTAFRTKEDK